MHRHVDNHIISSLFWDILSIIQHLLGLAKDRERVGLTQLREASEKALVHKCVRDKSSIEV